MQVTPANPKNSLCARALVLAALGGGSLALASPALAESGADPFDYAVAFDAEFDEAQVRPAPQGGIVLLPEDVERFAQAASTAPVSSAAPLLSLQGKALIPPGPPKPFSARLVVSQFVDVPVAGDADDVVRYSGRADAYVDIGGSNFGLDDSWQLTLRPEYTWGKTSNGAIGLIPSNTSLFRPEGAGDFDLSVSISKRWKSGAKLTIGKVNVLDISGSLPVVESDGHYGFQNLGLALPPTAVVPNTLTGAQLEIPTKNFIYRLWVFDPDSQYQRTGFETAFESGVAFMAAAAYKARIGKMPGIYNFAVVGSTRDQFAVDILPRALTPPPQPIASFGDESGELAVQLSAYQFITLYPEAPGKGWGILARFQASSGDPTFLDYSGYFGISGNPRKRPQDRFGLAYFQYSLTDELVDDIAFRLPIEDEQGVEAFYTLGIHKGFELTVNAQLIDSAVAFRDTGVLVGARLTAGF
ncbi:carbohydrate porin [Erythrobacter sp. JK5]|uniref:carbohydrate porin n=1 Tax=Erythrobacter sp. JK5 TaxID=2829500 RepID=UPI001BA81135|nr:carbohydrate porin [Erythrobacter sp. JK5]QUL37117.1 carbohydrate porin [Erythrobacter sp. JK5]